MVSVERAVYEPRGERWKEKGEREGRGGEKKERGQRRGEGADQEPDDINQSGHHGNQGEAERYNSTIICIRRSL